jgi:hypothetical protein
MMQETTAFAPTPEDLDEALFDAPIITMAPPPAEEEPEQGEP